MKREIVISNGKMFANFDSHANMRDLYYPYVGLFNHLNGRSNGIGIRVGETFSWIGDGWDISFRYKKKTLTAKTRATHAKLGVECIFYDTIHKLETILLKKAVINNTSAQPQTVTVYFYHWFHLNETGIGNTAYYHPKLNGIIHYKGPTYFFISATDGQHCHFDYTVDKKEDNAGSWCRIQEGHLPKNAIIQGDVDSAMAVTFTIEPGASETFFYYLLAGANYDNIIRLKKLVNTKGVERLMDETESYWQAWVKERDTLHTSIGKEIRDCYYRSLLLVRSHIDRGGAIIAANDTDIFKFNKDHYSYMWPRDGAFTAISLAHAGYGNIVGDFFDFCAEHLTNDGFMLHKYSPDGTAGSSWHPWCDEEGNYQLPIQEDETALILVALGEYYRDTKDIETIDRLYTKLIRPAAEFMTQYRDEETGLPLESYDLWEERRGVLTYTCATVYAGLMSASSLADLIGNHEEAKRYYKSAIAVKEGMLTYLFDEDSGRFLRMIHRNDTGEWEKDTTVESSTFAVFELGVLPADDYRVVGTMEAIRNHLWVKGIGGVARYEGDYYHRVDENLPGNPWVITTLWLANWYIETNRISEAESLIQWVLARRSQAGLLAEQYDPHNGDALSVTPLTWSHSSFCYTVQKLNRKLALLQKEVYTPIAETVG